MRIERERSSGREGEGLPSFRSANILDDSERSLKNQRGGEESGNNDDDRSVDLNYVREEVSAPINQI